MQKRRQEASKQMNIKREQGECRLREFKNNRDQTTLEYQENFQFKNTFSNKGQLLIYKIFVNPFRAKYCIGITTSRGPKTKYVTLTKSCLVIDKGYQIFFGFRIVLCTVLPKLSVPREIWQILCRCQEGQQLNLGLYLSACKQVTVL